MIAPTLHRERAVAIVYLIYLWLAYGLLTSSSAASWLAQKLARKIAP